MPPKFSLQGKLKPWLNPEALFTGALRFVPIDRALVIERGRAGLVEFLRGWRREGTQFDGFVIVRSDKGGYYVFSKEEFWLRAFPFLHPGPRRLVTSEILGSLVETLPKPPQLAGMLALPDDLVVESVGKIFNIHESTRSDVIDTIEHAE